MWGHFGRLCQGDGEASCATGWQCLRRWRSRGFVGVLDVLRVGRVREGVRGEVCLPSRALQSQATNPLDGLAWQDARQQGGDNFTYKGIKFATRGSVLHWQTAKGRWVPETVSQPCKRCLDMGLNAEAAQHWP